MLSELIANIVSTILIGIVSILTAIVLSGISRKQPERKHRFIAGFILVIFFSFALIFGLLIWIRPRGPVVVLGLSSAPEPIGTRPILTIQPPRVSEDTPSPTPNYTFTPSPTPSATPSPEVTPTPSPHHTPTQQIITPSKTPTPPIVISDKQGDCERSSYGISLITDARISQVTINNVIETVIELYGVARRQDFTEYLLIWKPIDPSGATNYTDQWFCHPYPSPIERDCRSAAGNGDVLQLRKLSDLPSGIKTYGLTLRVMGSQNGQYAECSVTLEIR